MANLEERMGVIRRIAELQPGLGRTAMMKYMYLLQTVRDVPLGYQFELYLYGPYCSDVLDDIASAEVWELVQEEVEAYGEYGYGYRIRACEPGGLLSQKAKAFIKEHDADLRWVVENFKQFSAADLELIGTIVWVHNRARGSNACDDVEELVNLAIRLKPHFTREKARQIVDYLKSKGILN